MSNTAAKLKKKILGIHPQKIIARFVAFFSIFDCQKRGHEYLSISNIFSKRKRQKELRQFLYPFGLLLFSSIINIIPYFFIKVKYGRKALCMPICFNGQNANFTDLSLKNSSLICFVFQSILLLEWVFWKSTHE